MVESDSDSDCWDKQDEDEILERVKVKTNAAIGNTEENITEIIGNSKADNFIKNYDLLTSSQGPQKTKIPMADLKLIRSLPALDAFLYTVTYEPFFYRSLAPNDSHEKVFIYLRILEMVSELELPGYYRDLLQLFVKDQVLLDHMRYIATKLFTKRYQALWKETENAHNFLCDTQNLFLKSHKLNLITDIARATIDHICMTFKESDFPAAVENPKCIELVQHLDCILNELKEGTPNTAQQEIYPSLEELFAGGGEPSVGLYLKNLNSDDTDEDDVDVSEVPQNEQKISNIHQYIAHQRDQLREDFMVSLRFLVNLLRKEKSFDVAQTILHSSLYADDVCIVLNEEFLNAHRHEMIFVDMLGSSRPLIGQPPKTMKVNIKNGALLCLTTSWEFENLILAKVTFTPSDVLSQGYIGVEILRQHNIGNIYNKPLICFETPTFFEPYHNVYNYLRTCNAHDFPMKEYFINDKKAEAGKPAYLKEKFTTNKSHGPLFKSLNSYQKEAFLKALNHEFYLIQGPPGTGKTHLSVGLVNSLIEHSPVQPIVLVTYTNESLDKFLIKLADHTDSIARFGSRTRRPEITKFNVQDGSTTPVNPRLKRLYYLENLEFKRVFEKLQQLHRQFDGSDHWYNEILSAQRQVEAVCEKLNCIRIMFQYYAVREKSIIALTTTCAAKTNFLFRLLQNAIVIFEEAAEILESHVLACLTPFTQHIIMIGDHMQLRPNSSVTPYLGTKGPKIAVSLFERLLLQGLNHSVLQIQYRMRPCIAHLLCGTFYKELHNAEIVETYPMVREMSKNFFFLSHEFNETKSKGCTSFHNDYELEEILKLANHLITAGGYDSSDIVILSPYASQVQCFNGKISKDKRLCGIKAATVDSFQGLEANIVLVSLVRSTQMGFLGQSNRICVLLSRAKHGMYIMGNMKVLCKNSKWRMIKSKLKSQNAINTEFPYDPPN